jgi:hypothetical protein
MKRYWRDNVEEKERVKDFVQCTLGCGCPEEVFESIQRTADVRISDRIRLKEKIKIGERLLIYIVEVDSIEALNTIVPVLMIAGRDERDRIEFNRFRLVVATDNVEELKPIATEIFMTASDVDEKVHLHLVLKDDIDRLWIDE